MSVTTEGAGPDEQARSSAQWRARRAVALHREALGARATAVALGGLDASAWRVFHDVAWPGRPSVRIDHVVVGPPGVLVVDSKNWNGAVTTASGTLRQDGVRRGRDLAAAAEAAAAVGQLVDRSVPVTGVLCFTPPASVTGWVGDVLLCATGDVVAVLERLARRLEVSEVDAVAEGLAVAVSMLGPAPRRATAFRPVLLRRDQAGA